MTQTNSHTLTHFLPSSVCLPLPSHCFYPLSLQVFPPWFCWTQRVMWSLVRAGWRSWTTRSAGSSPGTPDPCWSSTSPTPCSFTRGPASSCLSVRRQTFLMRRRLACGSAKIKCVEQTFVFKKLWGDLFIHWHWRFMNRFINPNLSKVHAEIKSWQL